MTNAMVVYERMAELQTAANAMHASGYFGDVKSQAQAMVKVLAGAEIGLPPFASMSGIHIVQGKPVLGANLVATLVKNDPRYDYRVKEANNDRCVLEWYEGGQRVGESAFTMSEANAAGLTNKPTWKAYASDMLFARALTRGARRYAPGIFGGAPIYTPEEMGVDTDEDGRVVEGVVVNVTPPATNGDSHAPRPAPAPAKAHTTIGRVPAAREAQVPSDDTNDQAAVSESGPLPDDELTVSESDPRQFIAVAAGLLATDTDTVKARLKALGYTSVPGAADKRIDAYRRLKTDIGTNELVGLFGDVAAAQPADAYRE